MLSKRILILVFVVAFLTLLAGCLTEPNQRPIITSDPVKTATFGLSYTYDVEATDPDEDTLTYFLTKKPSGMTINSVTGLIKWTPIPAQVGDNSIIITVSDGFLNITQSFTITVSKPEPGLTGIVVKPKTMTLIVGESKIITLVTAHYSDGSTAGIALGSCAYASSATNIAKVSNGVVTAIAKGTATITVGYGGRFDTVVVTVSKPIPDNQAPIINSVPSLTATVGVKYTYTIKATDPDGDSITYSLIYPPTGMTFDGIATISWIPAEVQIGYFDVTVKASDGILSDTQSFTITVSELPAVNHPPIITSTPGNTAIVDELYTYEIEATDPDGDVLTYSLITKPEGMTITSNIVSWTPTEGQIGYHDFVIKVSDGQLFTTRGSYIMVRELWLELTGITVEPKTMDLIVGDTDTIDSVTAAYEFRGYEDPIDLRDCTFLTSDSEVATVEKVVDYGEDIITTVTVTAIKVGTADILVSYMGKFDTLEVTVNSILLTSIVVLPETMTLFEGIPETIASVTAHYNNGTKAEINLDACDYESSNEKVATVSDGVVTPVDVGTTTITVSYTEVGITKTDTIAVTVIESPLNYIIADPIEVVLGRRRFPTQQQLTITAFYEDGTSANVTSNCKYSSTDTKVATVDDEGLIVAVFLEPFPTGIREVTISITYTQHNALAGEITRTCEVEVTVNPN